jgi:hypothetical protein
MSLWRRRAVETFPDLRRELTSADVDSTYSMWALVLLPLAEEALARDERDLLGRIYGYAAWSMRQPDKDVSNAAGVSFYEHVFDRRQSEDWIERVVEWIPDDVVEDVWPLWAERLSPSEVELLRKHLSKRPGLKTRIMRQS